MAEIELYSAALCPFAHRSRLTLLEKGIPFKSIEIDLQNKPTNFDQISPYGKVPVLKHGNYRIWESAIINEYLEEAFPEPPLLPKEPIQRAQARIWIHFADTQLFATTHNLLVSQDPQQQANARQKIIEHLHFIEEELKTLSKNGFYWFGEQISLVDLTYYPWFEQVKVLEQLRGFRFPVELERLKQWWEAVAKRESVSAIAKPPEFYYEQYAQMQKVHH